MQKKLWHVLTTVLNMDYNGQINTTDSWMKIQLQKIILIEKIFKFLLDHVERCSI